MHNLSTTSNSFAIGGDVLVNRIGYGAMRLMGQPGNFGPYPDWEEGQKLLHRAVELGVNFIDTAEAYVQLKSDEFELLSQMKSEVLDS